MLDGELFVFFDSGRGDDRVILMSTRLLLEVSEGVESQWESIVHYLIF